MAAGPLPRPASGAPSALQWIGPALMASPFAAFGLGALWAGAIQARAGETLIGVLLAAFGAVFLAIAAVLLRSAGVARRHTRTIARRQSLHPDEPWRWSGQWDDPRLASGGRAGVWLAWGFALFWNALSAPLALVFFPQEVLGKGRWLEGAVAALFPVVGVGLLVWAARATLQQRRFGSSVLELARVPAALGGELAATLHAGAALVDARELGVRLACIHRTIRGSGDSRSTHETPLWEDAQTLPLTSGALGPQGLALPVRFAIPADALPTTPLPGEDVILWRVEARASLQGVDFEAAFEVPVFATPESRAERTAAALERERFAQSDPAAEPLGAGVVVRPHPGGGSEILLPAGRHPGPTLLAAVFAACFAGGAWLAHGRSAPLPVVAACAGVAALVALAALELAFGSTRLVARRDEVLVERRLFGLGRTRRIPASEISAVAVEPGMQAGRRTYWDLRLRRGERPGPFPGVGRGVRAGGGLRERHDAERLAEILRRALGR